VRVVALVLGLCACDRVFNFDDVHVPAGDASGSADASQSLTCLVENFDTGIDVTHFTLDIKDANHASAMASQGAFDVAWDMGQIDGASLISNASFDLRGSEVDADVVSFSGDKADAEIIVSMSQVNHYLDLAVDESTIAFEYADGGSNAQFDSRGYNGGPVHLRISFDATGDRVTFDATTNVGDFTETFMTPFTAAALTVGIAAGAYGVPTQAGAATFDNLVVKQPSCL